MPVAELDQNSVPEDYNNESKNISQLFDNKEDINNNKPEYVIDKTSIKGIINNIEDTQKWRFSGPASKIDDTVFGRSIVFENEQTQKAFEMMSEEQRAKKAAVDLKNETPVIDSESFDRMYKPLATLLEEQQKAVYEKYYDRIKLIDERDDKERDKEHSRRMAYVTLINTPGVEQIEHQKRVAALNILFTSNNPESDNRVYLRKLEIGHGDKDDHSKDDEAVRLGLDFFGRVMDNAGVDIRHSLNGLDGYSGKGAEYGPISKRIHFRNGSFGQIVQDAVHEAAHHWEECLSVNKERKKGLVDAVNKFYEKITTDSKGKRYPANASKQFSGKFRKARIKLPVDEYITRETREDEKEILQEFLRLLYLNPVKMATEYKDWFNGMMRFLR